MIRYSVALLALVSVVAISGCGSSAKSACESYNKALTCNKVEGEALKTLVDKCVEDNKDAKTEVIDAMNKQADCIKKNSNYCLYYPTDMVKAAQVLADCKK